MMSLDLAITTSDPSKFIEVAPRSIAMDAIFPHLNLEWQQNDKEAI